MRRGYHIAFCLILAVSEQVFSDDLPTCHPNDFHYEYTECDSEGGRWRVSVPKPGTCTGGAPNAPVRGKDCKFTCEPGYFLDVAGNQTCMPCAEGKYSLGGGARFNNWNSLPKGFTVISEKFDSHWFDDGDADTDYNCTKSAWHPDGDYIAVTPGECASSLIYSAILVKPGRVSFEYQHSDDESIFRFVVQNDQCQTVGDTSEWLDTTGEGSWNTVSVELTTGLNMMYWKTIGALVEDDETGKPIRLRKVEITGVAFTSECTDCEMGTYSKEKSSHCTPCPPNTYALQGSAECAPCEQNTHYSEAGASQCIERPVCTEQDFYSFQSPCDEDKKTRKLYKWVEPQICRTDLPDAVPLPDPSQPEACPPCNPGMQFVNGSGCVFCPAGQFSDGSEPCQDCPVSTSPQYGLEYKWWNSLPVNFTSTCITLSEANCTTNAGWVPSGNFLRTSHSRGRSAYMILSMEVPGFVSNKVQSEGKDAYYGVVTFQLETICEGDCELVFLSNESGRSLVLKEWAGSQNKQQFVYQVRNTSALIMTWAFQQSGALSLDHSGNEHVGRDDVAKIYSVKVTNTVSGGAGVCEQCPRGGDQFGCIPCPDGHYIDENSTDCLPCPLNTIITSNHAWGEKSCKPCGPGLLPDTRGKECMSNCRYVDKSRRKYELSDLSAPQEVLGNPLFTSSGTQFYRLFRLSLCNVNQKATCHKNVSIAREFFHESTTVTSMVCQSTVLPSDSTKGAAASTQPVSLGNNLMKIVSNDTGLLELYRKAGFDEEGIEDDIQFHYEGSAVTPACRDGRKTIVSLRCDITEDGNGTIDLPSKCNDGTCDGCTFIFLWRSLHACPLCRKEDYDVIIGECVDGQQTIHYIPPKHCIMKNKQKDTEVQKCTMKFSAIPFPVKIAVPVIIGVGVLLVILLIYCWQKNKKLEYKYIKLVETAGGQDGELPGVDSCGLEDGEDDDVEFKESRGRKFFKRFKSKKDEENPFEAVRLQEKTPLT
ncbi:hypothetical protein ScPMuIL_007840 [Solemya velum]